MAELRRKATEEDGPVRIEGPCILRRGGALEGAILYPDRDWSELRAALVAQPMSDSYRPEIEGSPGRARSFGWTLPHGGRSRYQRLPWIRLIERFAEEAGDWMAAIDRGRWQRQRMMCKSRIGGASSAWTSGTVNRDHEIRYHLDAKNQPSAWSVMLVLREHSTGADLVLPEARARLALDDGAVVFFDGGRWTHGVSPLHLSPGGYRISVPLYALRGL
jgi:hypothetical protein